MLLARISRIRSPFSFSSEKAQKKIKELFGKSPRVEGQALLSFEKQRIERGRQQDDEKQKVNNYHNYEYFRGEDFIENIPYSKTAKYSIKDSIEEQKQKERISIEELKPISDHIQRARLIREKINAYHDKQKKYEVQEFQKYLSQYPGTVKGPKPQDDWEAYQSYAMRKIPKILLDQITFEQSEQKAKDDLRKDDDDDEFYPPRFGSTSTLLNEMSTDRIILDEAVTSKEEQNAWFEDFAEGWEHQQVIQDNRLDVPVMPNLTFQNYQHFVQYWMGWLSFRNSYTQHNYKHLTKELEEKMERLTDSILKEEDSEWMEIEANIPSLYRYYKCLPQEMQDHPGMKDIYLGLEYTAPDYTNEDKEDALNFVCTQLLPFDDISTKIMKDYTAHHKVFPSKYLLDKVFTMPPQYTWDMTIFLDEIRKQELRGEVSNENKDERYPEPYQHYRDWEEGAANLPVAYYDNDDGFWDPIISEKLRRYDAHKPMLKTRKHFTH